MERRFLGGSLDQKGPSTWVPLPSMQVLCPWCSGPPLEQSPLSFMLCLMIGLQPLQPVKRRSLTSVQTLGPDCLVILCHDMAMMMWIAMPMIKNNLHLQQGSSKLLSPLISITLHNLSLLILLLCQQQVCHPQQPRCL